MRAVIQRAEESSVKVNGKTVGSAGRGYMILLGVKKGDGDEEARRGLEDGQLFAAASCKKNGGVKSV